MKKISFFTIITLIMLSPVRMLDISPITAKVSNTGLLNEWKNTDQPPYTAYFPVLTLHAPFGSEVITIPGGNFQMGCHPDHNDGAGCGGVELPLHTIYLDEYIIDKYEVTNARYSECVATGNCTHVSDPSYFGNPAYADYPVNSVSWIEADNYCKWEGKRLPSEAEWEKAARGSNDLRTYPWGDQRPDCSLANFLHTHYCVDFPTKVGSYPSAASPYGVVDMAGNVWEWVNDWFQWDYYKSSPTNNPTGPVSGEMRVLRGGSYINPYQSLHTFFRNGNYPDTKTRTIGFRCAASTGK